MITILTIATSLGAAAATIGLFTAAGCDPNALVFFSLWDSGPYLGLCALALAVRRNPTTSPFVLSVALLCGFGGVAIFSNDLWPYIEAQRSGAETPMNCAGPIVEFGLPILQWLAIAITGLVAFVLRRSGQKGGWKEDGVVYET